MFTDQILKFIVEEEKTHIFIVVKFATVQNFSKPFRKQWLHVFEVNEGRHFLSMHDSNTLLSDASCTTHLIKLLLTFYFYVDYSRKKKFKHSVNCKLIYFLVFYFLDILCHVVIHVATIMRYFLWYQMLTQTFFLNLLIISNYDGILGYESIEMCRKELNTRVARCLWPCSLK